LLFGTVTFKAVLDEHRPHVAFKGLHSSGGKGLFVSCSAFNAEPTNAEK
jgi:hypothetical protein